MKARTASLLAVSLLFLALAAVVLAQPALITRSVMGGGGEEVGAGSYTLNGTLAEPVAGDYVLAGDYQLTAGFWAGAIARGRIYLPVIMNE
jgi:hypothetical protein